MKVKLAFGRDGAEVDLPSHVQVNVLEPKFAAAVSSADAVLAEALRQPIGSPALRDLAWVKKRQQSRSVILRALRRIA